MSKAKELGRHLRNRIEMAERKTMNIAIDYDNTYTADPELFDSFIALAKARKHRVWIVSARRNTPENREIVNVPDVLTVLTGLAAKQWYMEQCGVRVDIWIDDDPKVITQGM